MFSGMFTHLIKPALTLQQAKDMFGMLGYRALSPNEEELALNSKLVPADVLLNLASGFFTARMECQLLLSALGSVNRGVELVLQLVKERQAGHSLQVALENTKRKSDAASVSDAILACGMDAELDLYTEQADDSHMTSTSCSPPHASYMPPKETDVSKPLQKEPSQSDMGNNKDARQRRSLNNNPGPLESYGEDQPKGDAQRQAAAKMMCKCISPEVIYIYQCDLCKDIHTPFCIYYKECRDKGHTFALCSYPTEDLYSTEDQLSLAKEKSKDSMKTHHCMVHSNSDSFLVCHECQCIHDHNCNVIKQCTIQKHNVQPTGKLQPPQGERMNAQKRHKCLSAAYYKQDSQETGDSETPIQYHDYCWKGDQTLPETVCLTCKVFHFSGCPDRKHCSQKHNTQNVRTYCVTCFSSEFSTLQVCRYCSTVYCKRCCYENTMVCSCGESFLSSSSV